MTLIIKATCSDESGKTETISQEYTDSTFLSTAIDRAKVMISDYFTWQTAETDRWTKVSIEIEVKR